MKNKHLNAVIRIRSIRWIHRLRDKLRAINLTNWTRLPVLCSVLLLLSLWVCTDIFTAYKVSIGLSTLLQEIYRRLIPFLITPPLPLG